MKAVTLSGPSSWRDRAWFVLGLAAIGICFWSWRPPLITRTLDPNEFRREQGLAWCCRVDLGWPITLLRGDDSAHHRASRLVVHENDTPLGPAHVAHDEIRNHGGGRFSHWCDQLYFSTPDGSSPRDNGRSYRVTAPLAPSPWLVAWAALALTGALLRLADSASTRTPERVVRLRQCLTGATVVALVCLSVLATATRFASWPGSRTLAIANVANDYLIAAAGATVAAGPATAGTSAQGSTFVVVPFSRYAGPFLEIAPPPSREDTIPLRVRYGTNALVQYNECTPLPAGGFADIDCYLAMNFALPATALPPTVVVEFPIQVTAGGIALSWAATFLFAILWRHATNHGRMPWVEALAAIGAVLLALAGSSCLLSLRSPMADGGTAGWVGSFAGHGPRDLTLPWREAHRLLEDIPGESPAATACRLTTTIAATTIHYWGNRRRTALGLQVPFTENPWLWGLGEWRQQCRFYHYADPAKAIERGVGPCSQWALALTTLLREQGRDARVVQLGGHTVVTTAVAPERWWVLDPDFGVVIPASLAAIEADPTIVHTMYYDAGVRIGIWGGAEPFAAMMVGLYGRDGNCIEAAGGEEMLGNDWRPRERCAYALKWLLPPLLLLPWLRRRWRSAGRA